MSERKKEIKQKGTILKSGVDTWRNLRTGEEVDVSEILKPVGRQGFVIAYLSTIIEMIETLGNKKMTVVKQILKDMDSSTNTYLTTTRELASKTGVSTKTVTETLKLLEDAQIISRRLGAIMVSPNLLHKGREAKERALLTRFYNFSQQNQELKSLSSQEEHKEIFKPIEKTPPQEPESHEDYIRIAKTTNKKVGWAFFQAKNKGFNLLDKEAAQELYNNITI